MHKDFGSTSIQCLLMSSTNFTVWSMRIKVLLRVHEVLETIEPGLGDKKCGKSSFISSRSLELYFPSGRTNHIKSDMRGH